MTKSGHIALGTTSVAVFFAVWAFFSYGGFVEPFFLPTPSAVLKATIELFSNHDYLFDILARPPMVSMPPPFLLWDFSPS